MEHDSADYIGRLMISMQQSTFEVVIEEHGLKNVTSCRKIRVCLDACCN